jgi:hypothetical protein
VGALVFEEAPVDRKFLEVGVEEIPDVDVHDFLLESVVLGVGRGGGLLDSIVSLWY